MAASSLEALWDGGAIVSAGAEEAPSEAGSRATKSQAKAKTGRAKRGKGAELSHSFSCWKQTPDASFQFF